jgi:hypothetical protein
MGRNKRWIIKMQRLGRCERCGKPKGRYYICDECRAKVRKRRNAKSTREPYERIGATSPRTD